MTRVDLRPEEMLGRLVLDRQGKRVGYVADVGVWDARHAKFLLVRREADHAIVRLASDRVATEPEGDLRVKGAFEP